MKLRISTMGGIEEVSPISIDDNYIVNIGGLTCFVYFDDEDEVYRLVELNTGLRIAFGFASAQEAIDNAYLKLNPQIRAYNVNAYNFYQTTKNKSE